MFVVNVLYTTLLANKIILSFSVLRSTDEVSRDIVFFVGTRLQMIMYRKESEMVLGLPGISPQGKLKETLTTLLGFL